MTDVTRELDPARRRLLATRLDEERRRLLGEYAEDLAREARAVSGGEAADLVDRAAEAEAREEEFAEMAYDRASLLLVEEALERLEGGTYGLCLECGAVIPYQRLLAVPSTRYCVDHQEAFEHGRLEQGAAGSVPSR